MATKLIQNQIISILPHVNNEKILKAIYTILEQEAKPVHLSKDQVAEINRREENYLTGTAKSYEWDEVKSFIKKNRL